MKDLLLKFVDTYSIKECLVNNWIMKNSLVFLIDSQGNIKNSFYYDKNNENNINYPAIAKLDLYSSVMCSNDSIIQQADSNNKYSFMFKKKKNPEVALEVLNNYEENLNKKVGSILDSAIEIALKNIINTSEYEALKEDIWIKIFVDVDLEKYVAEFEKYINYLGDKEIFINTSNDKKKYLSTTAPFESKNVQKASGKNLESFFFLEKYFCYLVKINKRHIYFDNRDSDTLALCNFIEAKEKVDFKGYYMNIDQDSTGRGILLNFTSVNKRNYKNVIIKPLFNKDIIEEKEITWEKFINMLFIIFKDENSLHYKNIKEFLDRFILEGNPIRFKSLKKDFEKLIEKEFFKGENNKDIHMQLNIYNTIYGEVPMDNSSFILGGIIRYIESKVSNGFGDYRTHFRDMNFKNAKDRLEKLIAYHSYNVYACKNHELLKKDILTILNTEDTLRVNNIEFLKGYLSENKYY
ncbi:MAG: hypothetical protein ACRCRV_01575 [Cetobacterium sp.]